MPRILHRWSIFVAIPAIVALTATALIGCGSGGGGSAGVSTPPSPTASPSAGAAAVLVVLPDTDFQEVELSWMRTALTNAGYRVVCADATGEPARSGDVAVRVDLKIADAQSADYAGVVLIGGPGTAQLYENRPLHSLVRDAVGSGRVVGAICMAPVILARAGVLDGKNATVWADEAPQLEQAGATALVEETVVIDGNIVTGNSPDASQEFSAAVVKVLQARN